MNQKLVLGLVMFAIFLSWSAGSAAEKCMMCGMNAALSETKFTARIIDGSKQVTAGDYAFCCLRCFLTFEKRVGKEKIRKIKSRDYDKGTMFEAEKGFFLVESEKRPTGSMTPFMLIFSDRPTADKYQTVYGGRVIGWDEVRRYTEKNR
jgi:nitrous oxide reductase accessory protein NosL